MSLPAVTPERWRYVEQRLRQYEVDIQRLWRRLEESQLGTTGFSDALTPADLAAFVNAGGGGSSSYVKVYTLAIRGNAASGTITLTGSGGITGSVTIDYNDTGTDIQTALAAIDSGVVCLATGDLRWNPAKIKLSDPDYILNVTADTLARETNGVDPIPELPYCPEPASWW